jgi:hypothetical protein
VESTPKITYKDVKKSGSTVSEEENLAKSFTLDEYSQWTVGKRFYVTSSRISLALSGNTFQTPMPEVGDTLVYQGSCNVTALTGDEVVELQFRNAYNGAELSYRTNADADKLASGTALEVPFTVDLTLVDKVANALRGRELYLKTNLWFDLNGESYAGRKFVKVAVTDVTAGNEVFPLMVTFTDDRGEQHAVYMSAAAGEHWVSREFSSLFSFTNPKSAYPQISDEMWQCIINSRVEKGMTKGEVTLALGSPVNIDRGHDHTSAYERWRYSDGVYLIFEDGLLVKSNQ